VREPVDIKTGIDLLLKQIERAKQLLNRDSERIPRSLLRGQRANDKSIRIPYGEDSLQLAAG
jgi:hypothetical protein